MNNGTPDRHSPRVSPGLGVSGAAQRVTHPEPVYYVGCVPPFKFVTPVRSLFSTVPSSVVLSCVYFDNHTIYHRHRWAQVICFGIFPNESTQIIPHVPLPMLTPTPCLSVVQFKIFKILILLVLRH